MKTKFINIFIILLLIFNFSFTTSFSYESDFSDSPEVNLFGSDEDFQEDVGNDDDDVFNDKENSSENVSDSSILKIQENTGDMLKLLESINNLLYCFIFFFCVFFIFTFLNKSFFD